jgi:hypothetical protein
VATNDFLPFGVGAGANVLDQAAYDALAARTAGFSAGVAKSIEANKVWRQSSFIASVLAQFIADTTGEDVLDDGNAVALQATLRRALTGVPTGIVGDLRNGRMSVAVASATATFTADVLVLQNSLGGLTSQLSSYSQAVNLATTGAGGMDTGLAPASGYVALYAIYNPITGARSIIGVNATSAIQPEVYGGSNMPAGYTASALVSVWPTNASRQLVAGYQSGRKVCISSVGVLSTNATQPTLAPLSIANAVPPNARAISGVMNVASTSSTPNTSLSLYASGAGVGQQGLNASIGAPGGITSIFNSLPLATTQTTYYTAMSSAGTPTYTVSLTSFEF